MANDDSIPHDEPIPLSYLNGKDPEHAEAFLNENARTIEIINGVAGETPSVPQPLAWAPLPDEDARESVRPDVANESTFDMLAPSQASVLGADGGLEVLIAAATLAVESLSDVAILELDIPPKAKAALICLYSIGCALEEAAAEGAD